MLYLLNYKKYQNKTKSELWDDHRRWFNFWIFGLLFCLVLLLALNLAIIIQFAIDKNGIEARYINFFNEKKYDGSATDSAWRYWMGAIINSTINGAIVLTTIVSLCKSMFNAYKKKSYSTISFWPTIFIFIQSIYAIGSLFRYLILRMSLIDEFNITWASAISFSFTFIYILTWFVFSRNVSLIRRIFIMAERNEIFYQMMNSNQNENQQSNPFVNVFGNNESLNQNENSIITKVNMMDNEAYKKINNLDLEQLKDFAKKLSISGYENMSKEELVKIIYEIYNSQEKDKDNDDKKNSSNKKDE